VRKRVVAVIQLSGVACKILRGTGNREEWRYIRHAAFLL
jgi:hypothetical protein